MFVYTLISSKTLTKASGAQWQNEDLNHQLVAAVVARTRQIFLEIQKDGGTPFWLDFESLRTKYATYNNTFGVLLQVLGNQFLTPITELPFKHYGYVRYMDARQAGYTLTSEMAGMYLPPEHPAEDRVDMELKRPRMNTDLTLLHTQALISVNGFFHQTDTDGTHLYVLQAAKTMRYGNLNHLGITSFNKVGTIEKLKITEDMLSTRKNAGLKDRMILTIDQDLKGKSVLLVLGGYLIVPDPMHFIQVSDNVFEVNLQRLKYIERILESRNYLDLSSLQLTPFKENREMFNLDEAWSDDVIKRYCQLSQSFIVIVDKAHLFYNKYQLRPMKIPGLFSTTREPRYPLIVGTGRHVEYWSKPDPISGRYSVTVLDKYYRNYLYTLNIPGTINNVAGVLNPQRPFFYSHGFFLEIGAVTAG